MYRRRRIAVAAAALIVVVGGYTGLIALTPLPELHGSLAVEAEVQIDADEAPAQGAVDAQALPTAVGWADDEQVWANDDSPRRIASITKLVTVLVGLEAKPVEPGTDGPVYTVSEADAALVDEVLAQDGTFAPAPVGLELTTRQLLDLILVPSANNYAIAYSRWVFGSDEAFLAAANDWLSRNGLESVRIFEASGLSDDNVATAADVLRLSRLALANPLVAEIVSQSRIEIPELGEITTTNRLLGEPGVIGVKTGTTFPSGYSLAAAQRETLTGRELVAIAVTLDRDDGEARAADTRAALAAMAASGQTVQLVEEGEPIGSVTTWTGAEIGLIAKTGAETVLVPGEAARRTAELAAIPTGGAGRQAGTVRIAAPGGDQEVPVVTAAAILEPDLWWRLTHPGIVLGWTPVDG